MGKASKWFRNLLGLKRPDLIPSDPTTRSASKPPPKRRWSFVRSSRDKDTARPAAKQPSQVPFASPHVGEDPEEHAIAVAAANAALAEAAVAAARAAAAVVRLTSSSGRCTRNTVAHVSGSNGNDGAAEVGKKNGDDGAADYEVFAAIKIQSAFRGYLARRALRALKGLVRLQAMIRGHIERKKAADYLCRMQVLVRAQACARARRVLNSDSLSQANSKVSHFHNHGPPTPEKLEHTIRSRSAKYDQSCMLKQKMQRSGSKTNGRFINGNEKPYVARNASEHGIDDWSWDHRMPPARIASMEEEKSDKILEVDGGKQHFQPKCGNMFHSSHLVLNTDQYSHSFAALKDSTTHLAIPQSPSSSGEVQSFTPIKFTEERPFCTAEYSPFYSASSRGNPLTPAKSDGSRSCLTSYADHPNYMSYTESSRAKVRSHSAPKQRPQYERSGSAKTYLLHGLGDSRWSSQKASALHANFTSKAYPGSGRLDRLSIPVGIRH